MLIAITKEQFEKCVKRGWLIELENYVTTNDPILKNDLSEKDYKELSAMVNENRVEKDTVYIRTTVGLLEVYQYVLTFALTEGVGLKYITINQGTVGEMNLQTYSAIVEKIKDKYPAHNPALVNDFKIKVFEHKSSPMVSRGY